LIHLYGEETTRLTRLFEVLRIKKTKLLNSLTFLLRCRDHYTITRFLQFQHHIHSPANKIYHRASCALLRERIQQTRRELANNSKELLNTYLRIAKQLSATDWSQIEQLTWNKAIHAGEDNKARQIKKFTRIRKKQHPITKNGKRKETVINLRNEILDDTVSSQLQKGLNFAVTPQSTPIEDILTGVEKAMSSLPIEKAEEARQET